MIKLEAADEALASRIDLSVRDDDLTQDRLLALRTLLRASPGECGVRLNVTIPGEAVAVLAVAEDRGVAPTDGLLREIDALFGRPICERAS